MPSNRVEHDRVTVAQGSFTSSGYNYEEQSTAGWLTPNEDGLTRWDANLFFFFFSLLYFFNYETEKQNVVIRWFEWQPAAGWRTSKLWYKLLGVGKAAYVEEITQQSDSEEELAYVRYETVYAQRERERERERERDKDISYYQEWQQLQMITNLYKRLQSHFI